jgi:hypothetical protein
MRKTILYLVILALLGFGIYYFIFSRNDNPFGAREAGFTIKDTAAIGRLYLARNDGEAVLVERTDSGWMVDKKYKALPSTLNAVLATLYQQAALYPVTKNAYENVIKDLSTNGIKVEIYGRDGKKMTVFYVGGTAVNNMGTNMMMDGAHTPYVVQVAGFSGYLTPRYSTKLKDWRDRTVFNILPAEVKSVSVQYAAKPVNSFVISRENGKVIVKGDTDVTNNLNELNGRRAEIYMKYFTNVNCEGFLNGLSDMNSTLKTAPKQSAIDITGLHGQHRHVDIYWMAINKRSKNITAADFDVPDDYDADRLYAVIDQQDTVLIQYNVFKSIFRKSFEFFQKDVVPSENMPGKYVAPKNVMMHKGG